MRVRNSPHLPLSAGRYELSRPEYIAVMNAALPRLVILGSRLSPEDLREVAVAAGVEPASALLESGTVLYEEALRFAHSSLWPVIAMDTEEFLAMTPADALRALVRATYRRFRTHTDAVRLIAAENVFAHPNSPLRAGLLEESPVILHLDRVLMRGHDVGAFREGVSAEDVYVVILSLCSFAATQAATFHALYGMNAFDERNTEGLMELTADAVVAFLTTTMPTNQGTSYTHSSVSAAVGASVAARLYSAEHGDEGPRLGQEFGGAEQRDAERYRPGAADGDPAAGFADDSVYGGSGFDGDDYLGGSDVYQE